MVEAPLWEVTFPLTDEANGSAVSELLAGICVACSWHENANNPKIWDVQALFQTKPQLKSIAELLAPLWQDRNVAAPVYVLNKVPAQDWLKDAYRNFPPLEIGNFYIYGSHIKNPQPENRIPLQVNAATAFGSGEHESTTGCLQALHTLAQTREFRKPLDMGCGSGILAMAMAKTLDIAVLAVDNDPEAVKVTTENAQLNGLGKHITSLLSEGFAAGTITTHGPFDLITANILAGPLCALAQDLAQQLAEDGIVILSGLLTTQKDRVESAYRIANCSLIDTITLDDWTTLIMRKTLDE